MVGGPVAATDAVPGPYAGFVVNLTRIYTRTGDDGTTALGDMSRTSKNDLRLVAYADVDEANSALGVVLATCGADPAPGGAGLRRRGQNALFDVGAHLSPPRRGPPADHPPLRITPEYVQEL